ncbi:hypothetical protein BJF84_07620 [Rhodococcus sp. CUA-806]|nr:hypothetical protein BJF84_07620 [Rhodococcus sp. CUA-806]
MSSDVGQNPPLPEFEPWNTLDLVVVDRLIEVASTARVRSRDHGYRTVDIVVIGRRIYFFADPESGLGVTSIASPVTLEIAVAQSAENGISTIVVHGSHVGPRPISRPTPTRPADASPVDSSRSLRCGIQAAHHISNQEARTRKRVDYDENRP